MKLNAFFGVLLLILLSGSPLADEVRFKSYFIVWNVGQGQWTTWITDNLCRHFDMGGEKFSAKNLRPLCLGKKNLIFLSHWDWDHIGFIPKIPRQFDSCLALRPLGTSSPRKVKLVNNMPPCQAPTTSIRQIFNGREFTSSNDQSHVLVVNKEVLVPGDSSQRSEKMWSSQAALATVKILILGHHGSRTSTSEGLITKLPVLRAAVASARYKKYGHPHAEVVQRLKQRHIPLLLTEVWGNIWFEINSGKF